MTISGIDVSYAQGTNINWIKVRNHGIRFAFLKVNEGTLRDKTLSAARVQAIRQAGIRVGGYDFLYPRPGRTGGQEFDLYYNFAKGVGLLKKGDLRPVLDVETMGGYNNTPYGRYKVRKYVRDWVTRCFDRTGHHPIIYTAKWFYEDTIRATRDYGCRLWVASYAKNWQASIPSAFDHAAFHQYTDHGTVAGINGPVDLNRYLADSPALVKYHTLKHNV